MAMARGQEHRAVKEGVTNAAKTFYCWLGAGARVRD